MLFKTEEDLRNDILKNLKKEPNVKNIYKLENYSGRGLGDIIILTSGYNIILELKVHNNNLSPLQEYNLKTNPYYWYIKYTYSKGDSFLVSNYKMQKRFLLKSVESLYNCISIEILENK